MALEPEQEGTWSAPYPSSRCEEVSWLWKLNFNMELVEEPGADPKETATDRFRYQSPPITAQCRSRGPLTTVPALSLIAGV